MLMSLLSVCLCLFLSDSLSSSLSPFLRASLSVPICHYTSLPLSECLHICVCVSVCLSPPVRRCVFILSFFLSASVCLSLSVYVSLSVCVYLCLSMSVFLSVSVSG